MDDRTKQALMIAVLLFNVVVILFQLIFNLGQNFTYPKLFIGLAAGAVIGGLAFVVAKKMNG